MNTNRVRLSSDIDEQLAIIIPDEDTSKKLATKGPSFTRSEIKDYLSMWASGMTKSEIANVKGVTESRVQNAFSKMLDISELREMRLKHPYHAYNRQ